MLRPTIEMFNKLIEVLSTMRQLHINVINISHLEIKFKRRGLKGNKLKMFHVKIWCFENVYTMLEGASCDMGCMVCLLPLVLLRWAYTLKIDYVWIDML